MEPLKRLPGVALVLVMLLGTVYEAVAAYRLERMRQALEHPELITVDADTEAPQVFAKARWLEQTGQPAEAIRLYASLIHTGEVGLRADVLHNLGTLYLREAAKLWNARGVLEYVPVTTLVELAKENLREALRLNPQDWDARFNLEYAYRITPPPKEKAKADFQGSKSSVFSSLPGLPVGGP